MEDTKERKHKKKRSSKRRNSDNDESVETTIGQIGGPDNQDFQSKKRKRTEDLPTTSKNSDNDSPDETSFNQLEVPDNQVFQSKKKKSKKKRSKKPPSDCDSPVKITFRIGGEYIGGFQSKKKKSKMSSKNLPTTSKISDNYSPDETSFNQLDVPDNQVFQSKKKKSKKKRSKKPPSDCDSPVETTSRIGGPYIEGSQSKKKKKKSKKRSKNHPTTSRNFDNDSHDEITVSRRSDCVKANEIGSIDEKCIISSDEVIETEKKNLNLPTSSRNSDDSLPEVEVYRISDQVKAEAFRRIVEKCLNSRDLQVIEGKMNNIIAAIENDCFAILQRIINTAAAARSCKTFTLECLKIGFQQYGFNGIWNMFCKRDDGFIVKDFANYMEKNKEK